MSRKKKSQCSSIFALFGKGVKIPVALYFLMSRIQACPLLLRAVIDSLNQANSHTTIKAGNSI